MTRIGIITGLAMEADIVRLAASTLVASPLAGGEQPLIEHGFGRENAATVAGKFVGQGITALLSFGFAGALDTSLSTGQVVVAGVVRNEDGEVLESDPDWRAAALEKLTPLGAGQADLLSVGTVVADASAKARLRTMSGAGAVDMESFGVARVAHEVGVPFIAIRVILDTASQAIPPSALAGMDENGAITPGRALRHLLSRPGEIGAVIGLAMASRKAQKVLSRVAGLGLPTFGFSPPGGLG